MFHGEQLDERRKKRIVLRGTILFCLFISELFNYYTPIVSVWNSTVLNVLQRLVKVQ